jgi:hypothetical protein
MAGLVRKTAKVAVLAVALILPLPSAGGGPPQDTWQLLERYRGVTEAYRTRGLEDAKRQIAGLSPAQIRGTVSLLHRIALDTAATGSDRPAGWNTALFGAGVVLHVELFVDGAKRGQVAAAHLECAVLLLDIYRGSEADQSLRRGATLAVAWLLQIIGGFELLRPHLKTALNDYYVVGCFSRRPGGDEVALRPGILPVRRCDDRLARTACPSQVTCRKGAGATWILFCRAAEGPGVVDVYRGPSGHAGGVAALKGCATCAFAATEAF